MANYKNILLKDNQGNPLLPITLSYYVEYKNGIDVRSYLDTLSHDVDSVNSYIDTINAKIADQGEVSQNIIASVNDILQSYVQRPDHTAHIEFDNTAQGLSSTLSSLEAQGNLTYVTAQQAFAALDSRLDSAYTYLNDVEARVTAVEDSINTLETTTGSIGDRLTTVESTVTEHTTYINDLKDAVSDIDDALFDETGKVEIPASNVTFDGSSTHDMTNSANVDEALRELDNKVYSLDTSIQGVISQAGVTYVSAAGGGIVVNGTGSGPLKQGSVTVGLNLSYIIGADNKLKLDEQNKLTVNEENLDLTNTTIPAANIDGKVQTSQIEGGLDSDNIYITYSYTEGDVVHNDGQKTLQEFYTSTESSINDIYSYINDLDNDYKITVSDDQGADSTYARVYTISQGNVDYTINIPKDQFLKTVEYAYTADGLERALVFKWNLPNSDSDNVDTTYVPISSFIEAITGNIANDVSELNTRVESLETAGYITGVSLDGTPGTVTDGVVALTSALKYEGGTSTDGVTRDFLQMHGITTE